VFFGHKISAIKLFIPENHHGIGIIGENFDLLQIVDMGCVEWKALSF
jgi:hypothetical protein